MYTKIRGERGGGSGEAVDILSTREGEMHIVQGLPSYTVITALGFGYSVMNESAIACLQGRPAELSNVTLWNGETGGGKSLIMDRVFCHQLVSHTAQTRFGIWLCVHPIGMTASSADLTTQANSRGRAGYGGLTRFGFAEAVGDDGWFPWGGSVDTEETGILPGAQISVNIEGRIIIPPSAGISAQVVGSQTQATFTIGFSWYEQVVDLA